MSEDYLTRNIKNMKIIICETFPNYGTDISQAGSLVGCEHNTLVRMRALNYATLPSHTVT